MSDKLDAALFWGGCSGVVWLIGVALYFQGRADLYRYVPADQKPGFNWKWAMLYLLIAYVLTNVVCYVVFQIVLAPFSKWSP